MKLVTFLVGLLLAANVLFFIRSGVDAAYLPPQRQPGFSATSIDPEIQGSNVMSLGEYIEAVKKKQMETGIIDVNAQAVASVALESSINYITMSSNGLTWDTQTNQPIAGRGGAVGYFANSSDWMIANQPATAGQYLAYMGDKVRLPFAPQPAYAQGPASGYKGLLPLLPIWTLSRNIAYMAFAAIFLIIGMMMILRVKIDAKTIVSVQNALPRILITLVLVTFSYAIAGLLVDLMYVSISVLFQLARTITDTGALTSLAAGSALGVFGVTSLIFTSSLNPTQEFLTTLINSVMEPYLDPAVRNAAQATFSALAFGASNLVALLITLAILWTLFRVWIMLLSSYIHIILGVIAGPVWIALGALPGQNGFSAWLRNMLSHILVFPLVTLIFIVGLVIVRSYTFAAGTGFVAPYIGFSNAAVGQVLVGLAILFITPNAIKMTQDWLKAPANKYGSAWTEAVRGGVALGQGAWAFGTTAPGYTRDVLVGGTQKYVINPMRGAAGAVKGWLRK